MFASILRRAAPSSAHSFLFVVPGRSTHFSHHSRYDKAEECADDDDDKIALRNLRSSVLEKLKMQKTRFPLVREHNPSEDRLIIYSDFDLTCTVVDSSSVLSEIAIMAASKSDSGQTEKQITHMSSIDLRRKWGVLSRQYTEEYEKCIQSIMPVEKLKFNYELLYVALEQISDFEKRANLRVIESGVLKGLSIDDIRKSGESLRLQDGCASFFQKLASNENVNAVVHILSYCWCGDFIKSIFSSGGLPNMSICANELVYDGSLCTGDIVRKIESPIDKLEALRNIRKQYDSTRRNFVLYIGDSIGDLLCLLEADVGIVYGSNSILRQVGVEFGVLFLPLYTGMIMKHKEYADIDCFGLKNLSPTLYTVSSWHEIHAFVLGCSG